MSEKMPSNVESLLTQMEEDWRELKHLLQGQQQAAGVQQPHLQALEGSEELGGEPGEAETPPGAEPEIRQSASLGAMTEMEVEAIAHKMEKVQREMEVLDRLAKLEKQNRRITILGSMFMTMVALALAIFAYLMVQPQLWSKINPLRALQGMVSSTPSELGKAEGKTASSEPEATVKYVGSKTSNKYHKPDCYWAKKIVPEKLITFKSAEEAKEAGYVPCPACNPGSSD